MKASALKKLIGEGMLLEGSLNVSMRGGSEHWQLTDKADGKTRTMYVPARHVAEVTEALALWKRVKAALKELSEATRETYANAFAAERVGLPRGRPRLTNSPGCERSPEVQMKDATPADGQARGRGRPRTSKKQ